MAKTRVSCVGLAAAMAVTILTASLSAIGPTPVPDVNLTTLEGKAGSTAMLPKDGHWLIVYVRPGCAPCNAVLTAAAAREQPIGAQLVVIVAAAQADAASKLVADRPELADARWFVDADGSFGKALDVHEAPVIMGVAGRTIQWSLAGVLSGGTRTRSVITSWIEKT